MRKLYSWRLVFATIPLLFNSARAQSDHFAYAVTAVNKGGTEWVALRRLDTRSGEFSNILLNVLENNQNASTPSINQADSEPDNHCTDACICTRQCGCTAEYERCSSHRL